MLRLLMIEDDKLDQAAFRRFMSSATAPMRADIVPSLAEARKLAEGGAAYDAVLTDHTLPDAKAFDVIAAFPHLPVIVITGTGDEEVAVKALKQGAVDYLTKDHQHNYLSLLPQTIESAIRFRAAEDQVGVLSLAVESISDSVFIVDSAGRIEFANAAFGKTYRIDIQDILGKPASMLAPDDPLEVLKTGERVHRRGDGSNFTVALTHASVKSPLSGKTHKVCISRDITERKEIEAELKRSRDAAITLSKMKSAFLANMSHEIRTPMNGILGMAELLLGADPPPKLREYAEAIHSSGALLMTILNDILDLSKIESGKITLESIPFNPVALLRETAALLGLRAKEKGLRLACLIDPEVPQAAKGDPHRLRQILNNLISNAIKFTATGEIRLAALVETGPAESQFLRFEVSDTGIGIPEDQLEAIFNPFVQSDASTTRRFGGTGLGLSISRQLAELMGGQIGVRSAEGHGSTFWVELPLAGIQTDSQATAPEPPMPTTANPAPPDESADSSAVACSSGAMLGPIRILLAEDNPINQQVALGMLAMLGHQVDVALTGREALDKLTEGPYDLILMDCQMPEMDGYEAAQEIRRGEEGRRHIPIIAMTAHAMAGDREKCIASGMDDFISKPVTLRALREKLELWSPAASPAKQTAGKAGVRREADSGPLDLALVAGLKSIPSKSAPNLFMQLVDSCSEKLPQYLDSIDQLIGALAFPQLVEESHRLAGSVGCVGARKLANISLELEAAALAGAQQSIHSILPRLKAEAEAVLLELARQKEPTA